MPAAGHIQKQGLVGHVSLTVVTPPALAMGRFCGALGAEEGTAGGRSTPF